MSQLILASSSPRRKEILSMLGLEFATIPADIDESIKENEQPESYVLRLAKEKALKVAIDYSDAIVIGSDLTIDLAGKTFGKAQNPEMAKQFLENYSGKSHYTHCGFAIVINNKVISSGVANTTITFKDLTAEEITNYVSDKEWLGLAGSYGVQGTAAKFITKFQGSYFDILGLPIYEIAGVLIKLGMKFELSKLDEMRKMDSEKCRGLNGLRSN
ncbi:MAG: nucleoside triphosphate pyrophosphatase [bacterium]